MGFTRHSLLWFVMFMPVGACALESAESTGTGTAYGIWDRNGPWWNKWLDTRGDSAPWAPQGAWQNAVSALSDYALDFEPTMALCGTDPLGPEVAAVGNLDDGTRVIGSDLALDDGTGPRLLAPGEFLRVAAWLDTSAGHHEAVVAEITGLGYLAHPDQPLVVWHQLRMRLLDASCAEIATQVVQLAEAPALPTVAGQPIGLRPDHVVASASYWSGQVVGLHAKRQLSAQVPAHFDGPDDLLVACTDGSPLDSVRLATHVTLALGAGTRVAVPGDHDSHPVFALETQLGERVRLHVGVRDATGAPTALCYGPGVPSLAGAMVPRLAPASPDDDGFDVILAPDPLLAIDEVPAAAEAFLAGGTAAVRRNAYRESSESPYAQAFADQAEAAIAGQQLGGCGGAMTTWGRTTDCLFHASVIIAARPAPDDGFDDTMQAWYDASVCGDGLCADLEDEYTCPIDCGDPAPPPWPTHTPIPTPIPTPTPTPIPTPIDLPEPEPTATPTHLSTRWLDPALSL